MNKNQPRLYEQEKIAIKKLLQRKYQKHKPKLVLLLDLQRRSSLLFLLHASALAQNASNGLIFITIQNSIICA